MAVSNDYLSYVLEQLAGLGELASRRMFGGAGLYSGEFFFGLIADDVLYLRADDANRGDFRARGMAQFRPYAERPQLSMNYYETPAEVLEDRAQLLEWARRSVAAAMRAPRPQPRRRRPAVARRKSRRSAARSRSKPR
jgi:DNA transformation protein and related proteins